MSQHADGHATAPDNTLSPLLAGVVGEAAARAGAVGEAAARAGAARAWDAGRRRELAIGRGR